MTTALPTYHAEKILLCADRVQRAQWAMREWAELAKTCVDFFEGRQWSAEDVAKLTDAAPMGEIYDRYILGNA